MPVVNQGAVCQRCSVWVVTLNTHDPGEDSGVTSLCSVHKHYVITKPTSTWVSIQATKNKSFNQSVDGPGYSLTYNFMPMFSNHEI